MKKAIVMLLTAGLIATMTACGGTKTEETTNNAKLEPVPQTVTRMMLP